jgi:carbon monoxide dehydrogenase subunit G
MRFAGWVAFDAPRARVWAILSDPARLARCAPVPLTVVATGETSSRAEGRVGSGLFSATVRIDLEVVDVEPDRALRIRFRGGASGMTVEGWVAWSFRPGPAAGPTTVDWEVDLAISGAFAGQITKVVEGRGAAELDHLTDCLKAQAEGDT